MRRTTDNLLMPWLTLDVPWHVRVGLIILFWLGPSLIMAAFFLAMWAGWLPSPITDNNRILVRLEGKVDTAIVDMKREVNYSREHAEQMIRLLLATCRNVARNDIDRLQCENYWRTDLWRR